MKDNLNSHTISGRITAENPSARLLENAPRLTNRVGNNCIDVVLFSTQAKTEGFCAKTRQLGAIDCFKAKVGTKSVFR